ncbi:MAG: hypothetical protein IKH13_10465, partial [Clostridia bacterium]|nr:hypothetical protein [Clostridia bacterium]
MKKNLKKILCIALCVLTALCATPIAFGSFDDDPEPAIIHTGRQASGPSADDVTTYTHDARFATGYDIIDVIDVSYHNGIINWSQVYASGIREVMIRAGYRGYSEGLVQVDPEFVTN